MDILWFLLSFSLHAVASGFCNNEIVGQISEGILLRQETRDQDKMKTGPTNCNIKRIKGDLTLPWEQLRLVH